MTDFNYYQFTNEANVNTLAIENFLPELLMVAIRVDGYLWDVIILREEQKRYYSLACVPATKKVSVHQVKEDIDLTLPENASYIERQCLRI